MSLGATPFSLYQTLTPDQIAYQLSDSGAEIVVTEPAFLDNVRAALARGASVRHLILVDAPEGDDAIPFEDLLATEGDRTDVDREREAVEPDDLLTLIYTSGTTGPPKGVQLTHHNMMFAVQAFDDVIDFPEGEGRLLPTDGTHRRAGHRPLHADRARSHRDVLPQPARGDRVPARGTAELVLRRPADLGEAEGGPRGDDRVRAGRGAQDGAEVGARRRAPEGARRAGRRARLRGAGRGAREGGRAWCSRS